MTCTRKIGPFDCCSVVCGDCLELMKQLPDGCVDAVITDPPYPNTSGWFVDAIPRAIAFLYSWRSEALVFWSELEHPPLRIPLVAQHIWKRTNVNGKLYEPVYHFHPDGKKRRSEIMDGAAVFDGVGPGCDQYEGHPTQKNVYVMEWLVGMTCGTVFDPFCGSGTTLVAAKKLGRHFLGFEISPIYADLARKRLDAIDAQPSLFEQKPEQLGLIPEAEGSCATSGVRRRGSVGKPQEDSTARVPVANPQNSEPGGHDGPR